MRKIINCLHPEMQKLCQRAEEISSLDSKVKKYLSPDLAEHCKIINLEQGCLVIEVDNQTFATSLRYEIPELLKSLRIEEQMYALRSIKQRISQTVTPLPIKKRTRNYQVTPKSYEIVQTAADKYSQSPLQDALLKLGNTLKGMLE